MAPRLSDQRVPPHDLESEMAVLATVLLDPVRLSDIQALLKPEHFYGDANRKVYEAFCALVDENKPVDILSTRGWLSDRDLLQRVGGAKYLADILESVPAVQNVMDYARRVWNKWRLRQVITTCRQIEAEAHSVEEELTEHFLEQSDQKFYEATAGRIDDNTDTLHHIKESAKQLFNETLAKSQAQQASSLAKPMTGFTKLDEMIGGLDFGQLCVVAGRPSMGKSSLMYGIVAHTVNQSNIPKIGGLIISAETTHTSVAASLLCQDAKVPLSKFQTLKFANEDWAVLAQSTNILGKMPLMIDDRSAPSLSAIRASVRRAALHFRKKDEEGNLVSRLGLVTVDYLQLCDFESTGKTREQVVSHVARGLHKLAKDFNVAVLALAQLNRGVESRDDKRPRMSDVKDSSEIEQAADKIIALYRDEYYNKDSKEVGIAEALVLKSKGTATGVVRLKFTGEYVRFDNLEEDEPIDDYGY